jgi:hypothetical protein
MKYKKIYIYIVKRVQELLRATCINKPYVRTTYKIVENYWNGLNSGHKI